LSEPIIGSQEREEAKIMGTIPDRSKRSETAFFLRQALADFDVRMYDPDEGILLANRFISYLEVLQALRRLPANIQAVMVAYYGGDQTQEKVAERFRMSLPTLQRWLTQGLDEMAEIIWR
jgi:DNA-directed RNA polymerase specialized sigma24 family protein